jgi:hypothetical protein
MAGSVVRHNEAFRNGHCRQIRTSRVGSGSGNTHKHAQQRVHPTEDAEQATLDQVALAASSDLPLVYSSSR